jgi:transposase-like protein
MSEPSPPIDSPPPCPWCADDRIRDIGLAPDAHRWYRCEACLKTFFVKVALLPAPLAD